MDNRRLLLAVVLSLAVLLASRYFLPKEPLPAGRRPGRRRRKARRQRARRRPRVAGGRARGWHRAGPRPPRRPPGAGHGEEPPAGRRRADRRRGRTAGGGRKRPLPGRVDDRVAQRVRPPRAHRPDGAPWTWCGGRGRLAVGLVGADLAPALDEALFTPTTPPSGGSAPSPSATVARPARPRSRRLPADGLFDVDVEVDRPRDWVPGSGPASATRPRPSSATGSRAAAGVQPGGKFERVARRRPRSRPPWPVRVSAGPASRTTTSSPWRFQDADARRPLRAVWMVPDGDEVESTSRRAAEKGPDRGAEAAGARLGLVMEPAGPALALTDYWGQRISTPGPPPRRPATPSTSAVSSSPAPLRRPAVDLPPRRP